MTGAIILNFRNGNISKKMKEKTDRLKTEFNKLGVLIEVLLNDGNLIYLERNHLKLNFKRPDFVIYLDKDKYLLRELEALGIKCFNSAYFVELCDDKMLTHIELSKYKIPMPTTIAGPLLFYDDKTLMNDEKNLLDKVADTVGLPLIIKGVYGSLGQNMVYVDSRENLTKAYLRMKHQPILFQKYIKESFGRSVRCLIIDNKCIGAIERYNDTDYRSNYAIGTHSKALKINDDIKNIIDQLLKHIDIPYAGVDLLYGKDEMLLCEINSNAFFHEFEETTKVNVAKEFAEMVIRKVKEL